MCHHPELSGCITTLIVRNTEVANFCAAMDTLIDQDDVSYGNLCSCMSCDGIFNVCFLFINYVSCFHVNLENVNVMISSLGEAFVLAILKQV